MTDPTEAIREAREQITSALAHFGFSDSVPAPLLHKAARNLKYALDAMAASNQLGSSERLGPLYDGTRSITSSSTPDGGGVTTPIPSSEVKADPLREALEEIANIGHNCRSVDIARNALANVKT